MSDDNTNINSLRILSAIGIIVGTWSLLFEIYFFRGFDFGIYFARVLFTIIALVIFSLSYRDIGKNVTNLLIHIFLISLIASFAFTIYKIPKSVYINSQILSLLIFTTAIIFSWEINNQIIVGIYYNLLFAASIMIDGYEFYFLPNIFSVVIFVSLISALSVAASFVNYNLRKKLLIRSREREEANRMLLHETREREEAGRLLLNETMEKEKLAQEALIEKQKKIELLAKVNHDVRTPLNSILTYLDMINMGYIDSLDDVKIYASSVKVSSQSLLNTINNFVDYAKVESGNLKIEKELFDLNTELSNIIGLLEPLAKGNNDVLSLVNRSTHDKIYTDPAKYRQVIINLIANAIKFTSNGCITVYVETRTVYSETVYSETSRTDNVAQIIPIPSGHVARIIPIPSGHAEQIPSHVEQIPSHVELITTVEDTGPGIPQSQLETIFDPFISMKNTGALTYSSGLGLTICREFVSMLDGQISVESEVGKGTKFVVSVPCDVMRAEL